MSHSPRELLRLHVEAVWGVRLSSTEQDSVELLQQSAQPAWKLCAADIDSGRVSIWRPDVPLLEREELVARARHALALPASAPNPIGVSREVAFQQIAPPASDRATARPLARLLTPADRALVAGFGGRSLDYYFHPQRQPLIGVVVEERLLSLALSSRRTDEACELGIDTLPEARRRGYALEATLLWASTIAQEGLVPIYSAFIENEPSLALAAAAGYRAFARVVTLG